MVDVDRESVTNSLKALSSLGKTATISYVQRLLVPHVMEVFSEHDHTVLRRFIVTDYDLVENELPVGVKNTLRNLGSNPEIRERWEGVVLNTLTPENIIDWMRHPEEWLDEEEAAEQMAELRRCADVIERTPGGMQWLEEQVLELYRLAGIIPEDSTPVRADD